MDLLTYKELDTRPDAPQNPSLGYRAWHWLLSLNPTAVTFMVALSIGLGMVAAQTDWEVMMGVMATFWGLTVIALVGVVARWMTPGRGRHRMAS